MKLGVRESVRFYVDLLAPLAGNIMASEPETIEWVVTAPPLYVIPAGANLLAWEISRRLSLRAVDLLYSSPNPRRQDFTSSGEYSRSGIAERIENRRRLFEGVWAPCPDPADFRDRAVLVINDINVTGTQQRFMQRALETLHPATIRWLYLFQVDPALGSAHPEIESSLNHLNLESFEELAEIVARADLDYTWRCIARLLNHPEAVLKPFLRSLHPTRRETLDRLILREGAYPEEGDQAKLALLREP